MIETACQDLKDRNIIAGFRKTVEFFDLADKLFGQSEEDLVFRKLVGIEELFAKGKIW